MSALLPGRNPRGLGGQLWVTGGRAVNCHAPPVYLQLRKIPPLPKAVVTVRTMGAIPQAQRSFSASSGVTAADSSRATRPCCLAGLYGDSPAVHVDFRTCNVGRLIGSQEQDGVR